MKKCTYCGKVSDDEASQCSGCGLDEFKPVAIQPAEGMQPDADRQATGQPGGANVIVDPKSVAVGGWLAFFSIVQIYLAPVFCVVMLVQSFQSAGSLAYEYPHVMVVQVLFAIGQVIIVGLGIRAGYAIYQMRIGAIRIARKYLIAAIFISGLFLLLPLVGSYPPAVRDALFSGAGEIFIRTAIFSVVWLLYFKNSKRVKAVFPNG